LPTTWFKPEIAHINIISIPLILPFVLLVIVLKRRLRRIQLVRNIEIFIKHDGIATTDNNTTLMNSLVISFIPRVAEKLMERHVQIFAWVAI
jgi:hypothetical protein